MTGAVIRISTQGKLIHSRSYGYAQLFEGTGNRMGNPVQMTDQHIFDIASLTKVTGTTTAIMLLYERGSITLDDLVSKHIPQFNGPGKEKITIRHLLQHTAGLYEWYPIYYKAINRKEVYHLIHSLPVPYPVGEQRRYSDLGFTLLGEVVERVGGLPLEKFFEKNIFAPLGMNQTFFLPPGAAIPSKIVSTSTGNPYEKRMVYDPSLGFQFNEIRPEAWNGWRTSVLTGQVNDGNAWYAGRGISGAAGLFSTAGDLQKLLDMFLAGGDASAGQFLSRKTLNQFFRKDEFENGLGWVMDPQSTFMRGAPEGTFGHTGFTGTSLVVVPSAQLTVIILTNRQHGGLKEGQVYSNVNPLRQAVFDLALKYKPQD